MEHYIFCPTLLSFARGRGVLESGDANNNSLASCFSLTGSLGGDSGMVLQARMCYTLPILPTKLFADGLEVTTERFFELWGSAG